MNNSIVIPNPKALCNTRHTRATVTVEMLDANNGRAIQVLGAYGVGKQCCEKYDI